MKQSVLVLCTGNSCRSQMAEGILRHYGSDRFEAFSAGTRPSRLNPAAVRVMKEIGIDISAQRSKDLKEYSSRQFDYIVTVCDNANESCPVFPGKGVRLHWPFPDPPHESEESEEKLAEFRRVRDLILQKFKRAAETGVFR